MSGKVDLFGLPIRGGSTNRSARKAALEQAAVNICYDAKKRADAICKAAWDDADKALNATLGFIDAMYK